MSKTVIQATSAVVVLKCCECGAMDDVPLKDYFGETGLCDECENIENYMLALRVEEV